MVIAPHTHYTILRYQYANTQYNSDNHRISTICSLGESHLKIICTGHQNQSSLWDKDCPHPLASVHSALQWPHPGWISEHLNSKHSPPNKTLICWSGGGQARCSAVMQSQAESGSRPAPRHVHTQIHSTLLRQDTPLNTVMCCAGLAFITSLWIRFEEEPWSKIFDV